MQHFTFVLYLMEDGVGVAEIDGVVTDRQMHLCRGCVTHLCSQRMLGMVARYVKLRVVHPPGIPGKRSRHSRCMRNRQFYVSGKRPISLFQGIFSEISGPTLTFLRDRIDASFEEISRALVARSVGFLLGSLSGGALSQRWNRFINLWLSIAMVVGAVATGFQPWSNGLAVLAFLFFMDGLVKGIIATCKTATNTHTLAVTIGTTTLMLPF